MVEWPRLKFAQQIDLGDVGDLSDELRVNPAALVMGSRIFHAKNVGQVFGVENATTHNQSRRINSQFITQVADVAQIDLLGEFKTGPFNHQILAGAQYTRSD